MSDGSEPTVTQGSVESAGPAQSAAAPASPVAPSVIAPAASTRLPSRANSAPRGLTGAWWTLPAIAIGMSVIAAAMIVPQVEENRHIAWQKNKLQMDLDHFKQQAKVNQEFLSRIDTDVNLAERLAQQQMKLVREGTAVLDLKDSAAPARADNSPFRLTRIDRPPEVQPYAPAPGALSQLLATPRSRGYALGGGALLVAMGLIMGVSGDEKRL